MNTKFFLFFSVFILIYGLTNYYIGLRGWQALNSISTLRHLGWYWVGGVFILSLAFPFGRWAISFLPHNLSKVTIFIGSYWLAMMYYLFLFLLIFDLLRLIIRLTGILPLALRGHSSELILGILILVALIVIYGSWNAQHPVISNYEITIDKKSSTVDTMRIVMVSDIHLGWIVGVDRLEKMTGLINSLRPDLVLFPGDIIDEGVDLAAEEAMPNILGTLNPHWGSYAAMGNHEYISGNADAAIQLLNRGGVKVLRDQSIEVENCFYIVGRDDASRERFNGSGRMDLSALMADVDKDRLPVILLDHQPLKLELAEKEGIDLQFSGHTHLGQFFPNNYITRAIFEKDWGYYRKGNLQLIVSCGFGTWGPPIRIGNRPEILNILVHLSPNK